MAAKAAPVRPAPPPRAARAPAPPNYRTASGSFVAPIKQAPERASATITVNGMVSSRLNKRMAELGLCSRREADDWIAQGWVKVNGQVAEMGVQVLPTDRIDVDKVAQGFQEQRVTILLNKPIGYVSGQAEDGHTPAVALINPRTHWRDDASRNRFSPPQLRGLAPCGRLDIDSVGLLVLTQDGRVARQIIGEDSEMDKEYLVRVVYPAPGQAVARHPGAQGVVLVCAGRVHGAIDVAKVHPYRTDPFSSGDAGPLAVVEEAERLLMEEQEQTQTHANTHAHACVRACRRSPRATSRTN